MGCQGMGSAYWSGYGYAGGYGFAGCWACYGCHGCAGCYGCHGCYGGYAVAPAAVAPVAAAPAAPSTTIRASDAATVVVQMPADARLFVEGQRLRVDPTTNSFKTPALEKDARYLYTLKIEVTRDGRTVTESKDIEVAAGATTRVRFSEPPADGARVVRRRDDR